jgi:membrane-bound metal-dependent hydrolase YbcI (DUF457 family)
MPSPLGHSLAGLMVADAARRIGIPTPLPGLIVVAASAADFDFFPGLLVGDADRFHHLASHSLFAAALVGLGAGLMLHWWRGRHALAFGALVACSYATHLWLDMISADSRSLTGVPLFWPLSSTNINGPTDVFMDIAHASSSSGFWTSLVSWHNARALVRELLVMGGAAMLLRAGIAMFPAARARPGSSTDPAR